MVTLVYPQGEPVADELSGFRVAAMRSYSSEMGSETQLTVSAI